MHRTLTTVLLALMIVMLPLRGWMGGAMAVEMASQHLVMMAGVSNATNLVAARAHSTLASGDLTSENAKPKASALPCHGVTNADVKSTDKTEPQADNTLGKTTCTSCQVCHLSALTVDRVIPVAVHSVLAPLAFAPQHWASAELSQLTKPPVL